MLSKVAEGVTCADIMHPWTESCLRANMTMMSYSSVGCCRLMVPWFLVQYAIKLQKRKKLNKQLAIDFAAEFIQAVSLGTCISTLFVTSSCIIRYIIGRYTSLSVVFLPGFLSGLSYVILKPKLRPQLLTAFGTMALESIILKLSHTGLLPLNVYSETLFFMFINACLMYACKLSKPNDMEFTWFYKPNQNDTVDDGKSFSESIYTKTKNYFGIGLGIGILNKLVRNLSILTPKNIHQLFNLGTLKPGVFAASYVAIYEIIVYLLNNYFQMEKYIFSIPAGFLAGITYAIEPNLSVNLSAFINLIQLVYRLIDFRLLKRIPMDMIMFSLFVGTLFHIQFFHPKSVSKLGSKFIRVATSNRSNMILSAIKQLNYKVV